LVSKESGNHGSSQARMRLAVGLLPPDRCPWSDEPFLLPPGPLPERPNPHHGSVERAAEIVWQRLSRILDDPLRVEHTPRRTRVWVLDVAFFEVDRELRMVRGGVVRPTGELRLYQDLNLLSLLEDRRWFFSLSDRVLIGWPPDERFFGITPSSLARAREEVMSRLWGRLTSDGRFQAVANSLLHELGLDMGIWRLACEASIWWQGPTAEEYQLVWQHLPAFRQVHAENPGLLQLLPIYLTCHDDRFEADPVRDLKNWFRAHGLSEAGWRYLSHVDVDHFGPLLRRLPPEGRLLGLLRFLKIVEEMEFDTNLFQVVMEDWIDALAEGAQFLSLQENWRGIHPTVLRVAFGASRDMGAWCGEERARELPAVLRWAKEEGVVLSKQQIRAGWAPLAKLWRQERPEEAEGVVSFRFEWTPPTDRLELGEFVAVPLRSVAELRAEGEAMGNCLGSERYFDTCSKRQIAIYSIRARDPEERVAVASFNRTSGSGWRLSEVKGALNSPVRNDLAVAAKEVERRLRTSAAMK